MKYMNTIDIFSNFNIFNQVFGKKEVTAIMAIINAMQSSMQYKSFIQCKLLMQCKPSLWYKSLMQYKSYLQC